MVLLAAFVKLLKHLIKCRPILTLDTVTKNVDWSRERFASRRATLEILFSNSEIANTKEEGDESALKMVNDIGVINSVGQNTWINWIVVSG